MTNPDNIVRVRARNGGRASVYEANGWCQSFSTGLVEGSGVIQNTSADMNVLVGGSASKPDVLIAENTSGYKVALDVVGQQAVAITAPATNSRISAIVAYTDDLSLASTQDTVTGSPASCGLIVVNGTASASPSAPTDNQIRTAITADGATGSQAAYCVIATILVASDTTTITNSLITPNTAQIGAHNIDFTTFTPVFPYECGVTNNNNINSVRFYTQKTITITEAGVYLVWFSQRLESASDSYDLTVAVVNNDTEINRGSNGGGSNIAYMQANVVAVVECQVGDVITLSSRGGGSSSYGTRDGRYALARIF